MYRFLASVIATVSLSAHVHAQPPAAAACPFTQAELNEGLGEAFNPGAADAPLSASGMTMLSCRYSSSRYSLQVNTTVYERPADAASHLQFLAGAKVPIPADPDGAVYQEQQGDASDPAVAYLRQGVAVELRVLGSGYYDDPSKKEAAMKLLREKLAKLRRVP